MTGLLNHARIKANLEMEIARARRENISENLLVFDMIDIDHFKKVNDTYGHLTGDQVIQGLARLLRDRFRQTDSVGRYGGEEFAVVMPNCSIDNALEILENYGNNLPICNFNVMKRHFVAPLVLGLPALQEQKAHNY